MSTAVTIALLSSANAAAIAEENRQKKIRNQIVKNKFQKLNREEEIKNMITIAKENIGRKITVETIVGQQSGEIKDVVGDKIFIDPDWETGYTTVIDAQYIVTMKIHPEKKKKEKKSREE